jgi:hypothetical protein
MMAMYCLNMLSIAGLALRAAYEDVASSFWNRLYR